MFRWNRILEVWLKLEGFGGWEDCRQLRDLDGVIASILEDSIFSINDLKPSSKSFLQRLGSPSAIWIQTMGPVDRRTVELERKLPNRGNRLPQSRSFEKGNPQRRNYWLRGEILRSLEIDVLTRNLSQRYPLKCDRDAKWTEIFRSTYDIILEWVQSNREK